MNVYELQPRFTRLFDGLKSAYGTGTGSWVKRPLRPEHWVNHLQGQGSGIGVAPLRPDNNVMFAAIDLDEPDFAAAREMQQFLPGTSFIERSRSGNAHIWVFFAEPLEAWIAMGMLRYATVAAGKEHVEVFPKNHDFSKVRLGNYINLPYHGDSRPVLAEARMDGVGLTLETFIDLAEGHRQDPEMWRNRARWLLIASPESRERTATFGKSTHLHMCAEYVIENADTNPVREGHRSIVYFNLAKSLTNWEQVDHAEALAILRSVNEASPDTMSDAELRRILGNAERGQFTSTGCDDPLFAPYAHPDCRIANP